MCLGLAQNRTLLLSGGAEHGQDNEPLQGREVADNPAMLRPSPVYEIIPLGPKSSESGTEWTGAEASCPRT